MLGHTPETFNDIVSKVLKENGYDGAAAVMVKGAEAEG